MLDLILSVASNFVFKNFQTFLVTGLAAFFSFRLLCKALSRKMYNEHTGHPDVKPATQPDKQNWTATPGYRFPFTPFPKGWFFVCESDAVKKGQVIPLRYFDHDFIASRDHNGKVQVWDAFCPHLGAHIGYGGKVNKDNCVVCPFHAWEYSSEDGQCVKIPYNKSNACPKQAKLRHWHTLEKNYLIMIWWPGAPDGDAGEPEWSMPYVKEAHDSNWHKFRLSWRSRVHIQDAAENSLDTAHFGVIHAFDNPTDLEDVSFNKHIMHTRQSSARKMLWAKDARAYFDLTYYGLGMNISRTALQFMNVIGFVTVTPIDLERCEVNLIARFQKFKFPLINLFFKYYLPYYIGKDLNHDFPIWENKTYHKQPVLCKGDGPIMAVRKWAKQFYITDVPEFAPEEEHENLKGVNIKQYKDLPEHDW